MKRAENKQKRGLLSVLSVVALLTALVLSSEVYAAEPVDRVAGNMMLINDNGGWCWYQDEKIAYDPVGGNLLTSTAACYVGFGGVGGTRNDDMDTTTFNIATGKRTRRIAKEPFGGDDHNMGAFWIRPDGRYLHVYCSHYNDQITYLRLADYPNDGSSWGSEYTYNWEDISGYTDTQTSSYTNIVYLSGEGTGNGRLYNIIRVFNRTPCISYSDDWGQTWQYMGRLNEPAASGYSNFYHKFIGNGVDRIDFIGCENHPRNYNNSIFHGYIQNGKSYNSDGDEMDTINDQTAPTIAEFTPVFVAGDEEPGEYHTGWTNEIQLDKDGYPVCLYQTRYGTDSYGGEVGAADHRFFYARFDGSTWTSTELGKMGVGLHEPEQDYIGMGCIHPNDANIIYIATPFDPRDDTEYENHEIFKGVTYDNGEHWDWTQITFDSTEWNVRPAIPAWDANNTAVVWTRGSWNQDAYEQYDLVVVGMVEQEDITLGLVSYIDADELNTEESDGSAFTPTGPSGSAGAADDQWHEYTGYGNGGSCYTAGDGGTEDAPTIKTTISGLSDGTYDVFAYFWCDPDLDWGVRGGFETSDMLCFSKQSSQHAEASQFSGSVEVLDTDVILYRVYIGRKEVSGGASIDVYIDDYDGSYNSNPPARTTYDGVGVAGISYVEDLTPPEPNVMTWATMPTATGPMTITMTATTATDDSPPVQYYFECTNDSNKTSGWQTNPTYDATGLNPSTEYSFRVKARDSSAAQNETDWSTEESAITDPPDTTPPTPDPMTWATAPTTTGPYSITMTASTATDADSPPVQYYFECTNDSNQTSGWQSSSTYEATGLNPSTQYSFRVKARDNYVPANETGWSSTESATTLPPPTDIEILGSWATGTTHAKEPGNYRAFVVIAHAEGNWWSSPSLSTVTYGGQTMTKISDIVETGSGWETDAYVGAFILDEAGISAASSSTISASWSGTASNSLTSVFLSNVDQSALYGAYDTAGGTSATISTSALATEDGDMVIAGATCSETGTYTPNNGFNEGIESPISNADGCGAYKSATGVAETPSVTHSSSSNRQALIGFVVQAAEGVVDEPPEAPTGLTATAGNETVSLDWDDNTEPDLAGYNVYRSTTSGSDYSKLNVALVGSSDYIDDTVTNGIPYYYVVTAVDVNDHESGYSNEDSAIPDYQDCDDVQAGGDGLLSDLDGDCYVDCLDLAIIAYYWLDTDCGEVDDCEGGDFEPDGDVDFVDFSTFAPQWMQCNNPGDAECTPNW